MHSIEFVNSYFDAWNRHDAKLVADHLAADGIYLDVPVNQSQSHDELLTSLYTIFAEHKHHYELVGEVLVNARTIAFQYRTTPASAGDDNVVYQGAEFITMGDDAALTIADYYEVPGENRVPDTTPDRQKYAKSGLAASKLERYKRRLDRLMQSERLFLRPDLTLPRLADAVGCSVNHLSQVINSGFGVSFFDYVNRFRIDHARKLLSSADNRRVILNIAFAVGFNSNSAFYTAFKKHVGQTPAQYRRQHPHQHH